MPFGDTIKEFNLDPEDRVGIFRTMTDYQLNSIHAWDKLKHITVRLWKMSATPEATRNRGNYKKRILITVLCFFFLVYNYNLWNREDVMSTWKTITLNVTTEIKVGALNVLKGVFKITRKCSHA